MMDWSRSRLYRATQLFQGNSSSHRGDETCLFTEVRERQLSA